jgi:hypothetical protein
VYNHETGFCRCDLMLELKQYFFNKFIGQPKHYLRQYGLQHIYSCKRKNYVITKKERYYYFKGLANQQKRRVLLFQFSNFPQIRECDGC